MTTTVTTETRPQDNATHGTVTLHQLAAGAYGPWIFLNSVASVTCVPGLSGTMKAQFSFGLPSDVNVDIAANLTDGTYTGVAPPLDWTLGAVAVPTTQAVAGSPTAVRFLSSGAVGFGIVGQ